MALRFRWEVSGTLNVSLVLGVLLCGSVAWGAGAEMPTGDFGIAPVKCIGRTAVAGGPDVWTFDWPVECGAWPLVVDGTLRYPVGAYGGGYYPGRYESVKEWWEKSGFDFVQAHVHVEDLKDPVAIAERYRRYLLGPAAEGGGRVLVHPPYIVSHRGLNALAEVVRRLRNHPGLYGWDPRDEPGPDSRIWIDGFKVIRAIDPEHPIVLNVTTTWLWQPLFKAVAPDRPDFLSTDWYPVQSGGSVRRIAEWAAKVAGTARAQGVSSQLIIGNFAGHEHARSYPWYTFPGPRTAHAHFGRFCTVQEARSQLYQAVIYGVQQIQWWPYECWARGCYRDRFDDLGFETERLNREIHALTGPIFSSVRVPVEAEGEEHKTGAERDVHVRASIYRDALYVLVACVAEQGPCVPAQTTTVRLHFGDVPEPYRSRLSDSAEVLFEVEGKDERGRPLYYADTHDTWRKVPIDREKWLIKDNFGPYAVHVYRIGLSRAPQD